MNADIQTQITRLLNELVVAQSTLTAMEIAERMVANAALSQRVEECRDVVSRAQGKILGLVLCLATPKPEDVVEGMTVELLADNISPISGSVWGTAGETGVVSRKRSMDETYSGVVVRFPNGDDLYMYKDTPLRIVQK